VAAEGVTTVKGSHKATYVIIGYGVAGSAALDALLESEPGADVIVVEADDDGSNISTTTSSKKRGRSVTFLYGAKAEELDPDNRVILLSDGSSIEYEKLLLTMGSGPVDIPSHFVDRQVIHR